MTFSAYASRCSKFFDVVRADFLAAYCPVEETRYFSVLELKTQSLSLEEPFLELKGKIGHSLFLYRTP